MSPNPCSGQKAGVKFALNFYQCCCVILTCLLAFTLQRHHCKQPLSCCIQNPTQEATAHLPSINHDPIHRNSMS